MTEQKFDDFLERYLKNALSPAEKEALLSFLSEGASDDQKNRFFQRAYEEFKPKQAPFKPEESARMLERILDADKGRSMAPAPKRTLFSIQRILVAASLLIVCALGLYFYKQDTALGLYFYKRDITADRSIAQARAESRKAVLTLADGRVVNLEDMEHGTIAEQQGVRVAKTQDGEIRYTVAENVEGDSLRYNTVSTAQGGQYQVSLPDGTRVWLNAQSALTFPVAFHSGERRVELHGEAYFEVAHDKSKPFRVSSHGQTVEVLGTKFNIQVYPEEPLMRTSVLQGSVRVENDYGNKLILTPGEQAVGTPDGRDLTIKTFNLEQVMAWKSGSFYFENADLKSVMRDIARWYGVEVLYEDGFVNQEFNGSISRYADLSKVLELLELTETVHFKLEGRSVIVMK